MSSIDPTGISGVIAAFIEETCISEDDLYTKDSIKLKDY